MRAKPPARRTPAAVVPVAALSLLLCYGCVSRMAAQVRAEIVGVRASTLRSCLGMPWDMDPREDRQVWTYRLPLSAGTRDIRIEVFSGPATGASPPVVMEGEVHRETIKDTRAGGRAHQTIPPGTCFLFFEIEDVRVAAFDAAGRDQTGVNADDQCVLMARSCLR